MNNQLQRVISCFVLLLLILVTTSFSRCGPDKEIVYYATVNTYDTNSIPVAEFSFTQNENDAISLNIRSLSNKIVSLTYIIYFNLNMASWQYQGSVSLLNPGATIHCGIIRTNPARIDYGGFQIVFTWLEYSYPR